MKIEVTQCSMCKHYSEKQYCEIWQQYITNDAFYCACGAKADRKTEPQTDCCETCKHKDDGWDSEACDPCSRANSNYEPKLNNCETCGTPRHLCKYCIEEDRMWTPKEVCDRPQMDCENCWRQLHCRVKDEPQSDDKCNDCMHLVFDGYWYCECNECHYEPKNDLIRQADEMIKFEKELLQTDCSWK